MNPIERHIEELKAECPNATATRLPSGAHLIQIPDVKLPSGWNRNNATVLFVAPAGYPGAKPDCFWLSPGGVRLEGERPPDRANDLNPIPEVGQRGTWFSWHAQQWNPNRDNLVVYFKLIRQRLFPAR